MNKKGMTLVEVIISIVLISIVLIFLFSLLITVNDINKESEVNSTYLINKSLILKNIESDLSVASTVALNTCKIENFYSNYEKYQEGLKEELKHNNCLKFIYNEGQGNESSAYLAIYYYESKKSYVISYIHDEIKATRILPNEDDNQIVYGTFGKSWKLNGEEIIYSDEPLTGFNNILIPIMGPDGKDYSINVSYYNNA